MSLLMINQGFPLGGDDGHLGQALKAFDPDARDGRGLVVWTRDRAQALRFASLGDAVETWKRQSHVRPIRPDGQPNRPLTAYNVSFEDAR